MSTEQSSIVTKTIVEALMNFKTASDAYVDAMVGSDEAILDGTFTARELRQIADIMDPPQA